MGALAELENNKGTGRALAELENSKCPGSTQEIISLRIYGRKAAGNFSEK